MASNYTQRSVTKYQPPAELLTSRESLSPSINSRYTSLIPGKVKTKLPSTWRVAVVLLVVTALFICGLLLGYYIRHVSNVNTDDKNDKLCLKPPQTGTLQTGPRHLELLHENLMYSMSGDKQAAYLRNYAAKQVYSGSEHDERLTRLLRAYFNKYGFDNVQLKQVNEKYDVLTSLPDVTRPNEVYMVDVNNDVIARDETLRLPERGEGELKGFIEGSPDGSINLNPASDDVASGEADVMKEVDDVMETPVNVTSSRDRRRGGVTSRERRQSGVAEKAEYKFEDELLDLNDDTITPELIARLKKLKDEPMPLPLPELPPYVAYSPPANVTGQVVYVSYGGPEEYGILQKEEIKLRGRVAIARLGKQTIREKVRQAEGHGIVGLLLYMDPADDFITPFKNCNDTIAFWANANDDGKGDPLTPNYPATDGMVRFNIKESAVPKIPVQTVSCRFARRVLSAMSGQVAPPGWEGGIDVTYRTGNKADREMPWQVRIIVHNKFLRRPIYNVIATLTGEVEPDKYVMVGANRNSLGLGPFGGVFGTAGLVELARNLGILINREKWRPKRTIKICSWGGGDMGDIGLLEHLQEYRDVLRGRIISYINLDQPVLGSYNLRVASSPTLHNIIYNAAQRVPSPDDRQSMVYETWRDRSVEVDEDFKPYIYNLMDPRLMRLPDPFFTELGVPSTHIQYLPRNNKAFNLSLIADEISHHWRYHNTVNRMSSLLLLSLVDADVLQYDLDKMAAMIHDKVRHWLNDNTYIQNSTAVNLLGSASRLVSAARAMHHFIMTQADFDVYSEKRMINERLVNCENVMAKAYYHLEVLSIKLRVVKKLSSTQAELPRKREKLEEQLSALQRQKSDIVRQRKQLMAQQPETREKQQQIRQLLRQQQDLSKPIKNLKVEIFKIEQQELSIQLLTVTIFTKDDFSLLLQYLRSAKEVLKTEL